MKCGCACEDVRKKENPRVKNQTTVLILSVINIFLCFPLGLIALIFVFLAMSADTQEEADRKIKTATMCNYVSIVILVLYLLYFIVIIGFSH